MISLKHVFKISEIILIIILNLSCKKNEKPAVSPVVTTTPVMNILYATENFNNGEEQAPGNFIVC